ncbi:prephenate dehydratase [Paludifilum halophilum]|uniref:Prephenate dehydratase n=1 Tax=Paludifilum halophilum TaxID=1642702 RepID=A0A235BCB2_9BACL|nr:prephenate dehydratase [Paludifilum halophilum]OYD09923.1 hypothetical protein CHM34_02820 [Paludifilum halophilum]
MKEPVAYLGPVGTFTHEAARALFPGHDQALTPYSSIPDVLTAVDRGECEYGVVPVENAIEGSVNLTLDWLIHQVEVPITAELIYPISQYLMIHPDQAGRPLNSFTRILSHPQALAQTQMYLRKHLPRAALSYVESTADAALRVQENPGEAWVAVGTRSAGELYGLKIVAREIQDVPNNFTRFIAVGKEISCEPGSSWKSSLLVSLPSDFPGALYRVLQSFARHGVNLSRIESRPTKKRLGTYHFFIDAETKLEHPSMKQAIQEVEAWQCRIRRFGSYPSYTFDKINVFQPVDNREAEAYNQR